MRRWLTVAFLLLAWLALPSGAASMSEPETRQVLVLLHMPPPHFRPDGNYSGGYADTAGRSARKRIATALARANGLQMATDWPMPVLGVDCYVMNVPPSLNPADVADRLAAAPGVAWAQVMNVFHPLAHDDPLFSLQPAASQWHLDELHRSASGRGVRVAVIDSAIQTDHPDLRDQVTVKLDLTNRLDTPELHGTAVAGIIAARADNHVGIAGVAPLAQLLGLRACWETSPAQTLCTSLSLALALNAALERDARIINLSLGGPPDRLIQRLVESALARGIAVVAAVDRSAPNGGFPAALPGVVAVVDTTSSSKLAHAVVAPGTDVLTTLPGSRWGAVSGASYAAAHVSGLLALILDARSRDGLTKSARVSSAADLVSDTEGRVDACASLARASTSCACQCGSVAAIGSATRH